MMKRVTWHGLMVAGVCAFNLAVTPGTEAYEEIFLAEGGSLSGTVHLHGKVPMPKGYNLTTVPDPVYCGRISDGRGWRLLQPFDVGSQGEFRNVVVYLDGIEKGKSFGEYTPPRIEAIDCRFMPYITLVRDLHNVMVVNVADHEGRFQLTDIPPGTYKLKVWHPYIGDKIEQTVTIEPNTQSSVDVTIEAPTGRLYANQMVENAYVRYTITEDVQSQIVPTLEKQRLNEGP